MARGKALTQRTQRKEEKGGEPVFRVSAGKLEYGYKLSDCELFRANI